MFDEQGAAKALLQAASWEAKLDGLKKELHHVRNRVSGLEEQCARLEKLCDRQADNLNTRLTELTAQHQELASEHDQFKRQMQADAVKQQEINADLLRKLRVCQVAPSSSQPSDTCIHGGRGSDTPSQRQVAPSESIGQGNLPATAAKQAPERPRGHAHAEPDADAVKGSTSSAHANAPFATEPHHDADLTARALDAVAQPRRTNPSRHIKVSEAAGVHAQPPEGSKPGCEGQHHLMPNQDHQPRSSA